MIVVFAYVVGCRVAVAQERGLEPPANSVKASNGQSCRIQRQFSFTARWRRGCCVRNYEVWFGTKGAAAQDSQASFIWPEIISTASRLQIPDVLARNEKHGQRSWDTPKNGARNGLRGF